MKKAKKGDPFLAFPPSSHSLHCWAFREEDLQAAQRVDRRIFRVETIAASAIGSRDGAVTIPFALDAIVIKLTLRIRFLGSGLLHEAFPIANTGEVHAISFAAGADG